MTPPRAPDPCGVYQVGCTGGGITGIGQCIALSTCRATVAIQNAVFTGIEYIAVLALVLLGLYLLFAPEVNQAVTTGAKAAAA